MRRTSPSVVDLTLCLNTCTNYTIAASCKIQDLLRCICGPSLLSTSETVNDEGPAECCGSLEPASRSAVPDSYQEFQLPLLSSSTSIRNSSYQLCSPHALNTNLKAKLDLDAYALACLQILRKGQERERESKSPKAEPVVSRDRFQLEGIFSVDLSPHRRH